MGDERGEEIGGGRVVWWLEFGTGWTDGRTDGRTDEWMDV